MRLPKPEMVLIDLDGTLVDSVPDLAYCIDEMMNRMGLVERGEAAVRQWVGNGVERLVKRALVNRLEGEPDLVTYEKSLAIFRQLYGQNACQRSRLYDGVRQGLNYMRQAGFRLGCVTNKAAEFTQPILSGLDIAEYFEVVINGDDTPRKKPDPLPLLTAAEKMAVRPEACLMIGDSQSDVKAARAAGFGIICMSYGYNHGQDIRSFAPDAVIDSFVELESIL